jgi:stress response protein YsnF
MAYETIVAAFDNPAHAKAAVKALKAAGFAGADISEFDGDRLKGAKNAAPGERAGLWQRMFGSDLHRHEADVYRDTVERGGAIVSARVMDKEVAHAVAILDLNRPVDVHDRAVTAGIAPAARVEAVEKKIDAVPLADMQKVAVPSKLAEAHDEVLHLAEEQLQVGKEMVETGRTRVRRFVTEREASADVSLHEEHADLMRRAISDPKFVGTIDWADKEIEVIETAEHALAKKMARIVEEVHLKKVGSDHVDKLRRQQVKVEQVGPDGKIIQGRTRQT